MDFDYGTFLAYHESQLSGHGVPEQYWPVIYRKIVDHKFDLADFFSVEQVFQHEEYQTTFETDNDLYEPGFRRMVADEDIEADDTFNVFLSLHIFTFDFVERHRKLAENTAILERLLPIFGLKMDSLNKQNDKQTKEKLLDRSLFKFAGNFSLDIDGCGKTCKTFWYVLDEFGSAMSHSFQPNMKCLPFVNLLNGQCFNLLWPLRNIAKGETVTRNRIDPLTTAGNSNKDLVTAMMIPWKEASLGHVECRNMTENRELFVFKLKPEDVLSTEGNRTQQASPPKKLKVYSEYIYIGKFLNDAHFEHTDDRSSADILWLLTPFYDYKQLANEKASSYVNQFPFESVLTLKDLFTYVSRRSKFVPRWNVATFDLQNELPAFVSYYQSLQDEKRDNNWIVKPWNLSRSKETVITEDLVQIIKLRNSIPKIVSKYIEDPVLFHRKDIDARVKFDLRFIVLLRSVSPLRVFVYTNFWIRFANKAFGLDDLDDYQKHFTVMNYVPGADQKDGRAKKEQVIKQMQWQDFVKAFDQQNSMAWKEVQEKIYASIKDCFECSVAESVPFGIGDNGQSRALYGIDVMLRNDADKDGEKTIAPTILEVNYAPDCKRACDYYPDFYNNIFNALFRDKLSNDIVEL